MAKINIKEIKHFSPDGKSMPNGVFYQKGGFLMECDKNFNNFITDNNQYLIDRNGVVNEALHDEQYGLFDYRGGILIFSTNVNSIIFSDNKLYNWLVKKFKSFKNRIFVQSKINKAIKTFKQFKDKEIGGKPVNDVIGAFSIGKFFKGRYISDNGDVFDEKSTSIEINGISTEALMYIAEEICLEFNQETVLVKDLNKNKIYLMDSKKNGSYDLKNINKLSD